MINQENLFAYASGYIDGDGCVYIGKTIQKPKNVIVYEYSIQVVSVKIKVLECFKAQFGGTVRKKPDRERHREAFCWTIKNESSVSFVTNILPYMIDKKKQCEIFLTFAQSIRPNNFKIIDNDIINQRNNLIELSRKDKHMDNLVTKEAVETLKNIKNTITPTEIDFPYLAGLIDSEGCFRIKKWKPKNRPNSVYNITVEIGNTKLPILPWLVERFGGSVVFIAAKTNKKASATWTLSAAALYAILPKIRPFLVTKQEVCDKLIEFQKTILPNGGDRHSELFRALFEKRREIRERIIDEVHKFNLKGSH